MNEEGVVVVHDLTSVVGEFNPKMMCYLNGIREVHMSMAGGVDAMDFVECLAFLQSLSCLIIDKCIQFNQSHVLRAVENNTMIKYLDVASSTTLSFEAAHYIMGSLKDLFYFAFDPKYPEMVTEWRNLIRIFRYKNVKFGGKILDILEED